MMFLRRRVRLVETGRCVIRLWALPVVLFLLPACYARVLKEKAGGGLGPGSWPEEVALSLVGEDQQTPFPANINGTYGGTWDLLPGIDSNSTSAFPELQKKSGTIFFHLSTFPTENSSVLYVHADVVVRDGMYIFDRDLHFRLEGVYIWTLGHVLLVSSEGYGEDLEVAGDGQQQPPGLYLSLRDPSKPAEVSAGSEGHEGCRVRMLTQLSVRKPDPTSGFFVRTSMDGRIESLRKAEDGRPTIECHLPLHVNATAVDLEEHYNKAVNYTLMVTFVSFCQVLFLIRQMEHSNTQSGSAKVSLLTIGQQAILDAYLCLLHLTFGIVVESLFNAFATAAFFKFVIFSIFEMRYLLAIWKARRPASSGEGWDTMRRELSILYSRFYGFLLAGILLMYEFHTMLRWVLLFFYSFWIPQIITNVTRDSRKPLHPHYIIGITATRLAIPLYTFGCPKNFMRVMPSAGWCIVLTLFLCAQAAVLLLQHYFGSRCFIPKSFLPEKYSYFRRVDLSAILPQNAGAGEGDEPSAIDCVICMAPVDTEKRSSDRMVTPCDHFFHANCLQRWMDIKMECPTCRRTLPPL